MLSIEEALKLIAGQTRPLAPRRVPLGDATGLVLAEDIASDVNSPPYDKALMDGYAVRSTDHEPQRRILEEIAAGAVPHFPLTPCTASRIMTGAPLPEGADAVVAVEQTELVDERTVRLCNAKASPGQHVLPLGASLRAGDAVLHRGAVLRAIEIAVLAEIGRGIVTAIPRPRVAVLPTGNELVHVSEKPANGQIRNSNGPMLVAAASRAEADAVELGIARDNRDELTRWIQQGLAADVLVLSGGVSAGKFDLVPEVLAELGVEQVLHKVALRPGKPLWFGVKRDGKRRVLVFALPGNPVSSLVCFELFVRPAIAALSGRGFAESATIEARLSHAYEHAGGRAACLPARVRNRSSADLPKAGWPRQAGLAEGLIVDLDVDILPWHGSADIFALTRANGLVRLSAEKQSLVAGTPVRVILI